MYSIPAVLIQPGSPQNSLYIGLQADLNIQWQQNRHFDLERRWRALFRGDILTSDQGRKKRQLLRARRLISLLNLLSSYFKISNAELASDKGYLQVLDEFEASGQIPPSQTAKE